MTGAASVPLLERKPNRQPARGLEFASTNTVAGYAVPPALRLGGALSAGASAGRWGPRYRSFWVTTTDCFSPRM